MGGRIVEWRVGGFVRQRHAHSHRPPACPCARVRPHAQDRNETLFYQMLVENFVEMAPIIYSERSMPASPHASPHASSHACLPSGTTHPPTRTRAAPTVGWACMNYHKLYRRPRGMFFSANDRGEMVRARVCVRCVLGGWGWGWVGGELVRARLCVVCVCVSLGGGRGGG